MGRMVVREGGEARVRIGMGVMGVGVVGVGRDGGVGGRGRCEGWSRGAGEGVTLLE